MKIFNTFSQKKEIISLKKPVGIYVCGVTPYDTTHIGHAFTFVTYDVLVRYLRFLGAKVTYVQNVTDIDDDIILKAKALNTTWKELGISQTKLHLENMDSLNALRPDYYPKATGNIQQMIDIIKVLEEEGLAYVRSGNVYFSINRDKNFGKLSKYGYPAMLQIANDRGNFPLDPHKEDPLDFVLWQSQQNKDDPSWPSPWGDGRPGWHIECSAMSMRYLGKTITIHGGGEDLIFPHHECEIAQSENFTNQQFVKTWMHTAMVYCEGKKMSKSLGNMIFIHDLVKQYSSNLIRIFLLMHHYRKSFNYNEVEFKKVENMCNLLKSCLGNEEKLSPREVEQLAPEFLSALDDDLDVPQALEILLEIAKSTNQQKRKVVFTCLDILGIKIK